MTTITAPTDSAPVVLPPALGTSPALHSLTVVLPCFNEAANIAAAVSGAAAAAELTSEDYEIVVVDDGSTDDSAGIVGGLVAADRHVRLIVHPHNRGYGEALRAGIDAARMDWVLLMDADLQFDVGDLAAFVALTPAADALWGRRVVRRDTVGRRTSAKAWNRLVRALFRVPVRDVDCGFKLIRRAVLQRFQLQTGGAMISTELAVQCRAEGARFAEVEVRHHPRAAGEETGGNPRVILRAFRELSSMYGTLRRLSHTPVA